MKPARPWGTIAFVAFLVLTVVIVLRIDRSKPVPPATTDSSPTVYHNERLGKDAAGKPVWFVRWAKGSRDHVVELQIPKPYVNLAFGCLTLSKGDVAANCKQPFTLRTPQLRVMLPDFTPLPDRQLRDEEWGSVVHIIMESVIGGRDRSVDEALQIQAYGNLEIGFLGLARYYLHVWPWDQSLLVYKEPRFGLSRLGLSPDPSNQAITSFSIMSFHDFLFLPRTVAQPDIKTCPRFEPPKQWGEPPSVVQ